ncbi:site-specific integrase [Sphingobium abikonense]|uniref:site-specific integrase n=1 Tax=Sphingobium abikonense TaxID=86193 RepID=UPI003513B23C
MAAPTRDSAWRLRDVLGTYWSDHAKGLKSASVIFFQFELLSEFLGPDLPIGDLTSSLLLDYRAARRGGGIKATTDMLERNVAWRRRQIDEKKFVRAVAPQTVNRDLANLQAALNWARDMHGKMIPAINWRGLKAKEAPFRSRFASGDEFAHLMEAAHPSMRDIILCAVTTGLRRGNIFSMEWHQIDLGASTITLPIMKGGKPHTVKIAPALRAALGRTPTADRKGRVFDTTNYKRRWTSAVKDAGLVDFKFHDLRHTFGSWARINGADLLDICEALAHSSVSVTQRYAHVKSDRDTTAFDRVAQAFGSQSASQSEAKRA